MDREDAREIAVTINVVREGLVAGDGEAVCDSLVEEGQRITVDVAERELDASGEDCEGAVEAFAATFEGGEGDLLGPRPYRASDVDTDPADDPGFNDVTDTVPEGGPTEIEVSCLEGDGNSYFAYRQDDGSWKLGVPFCTGR